MSNRALWFLIGLLSFAAAVACQAAPAAKPAPATTPAAGSPAAGAASPAATAAPGTPQAKAAASPAAKPSANEVEPAVRLGWSFLFNTMDPATSVGFNVRRNEIFEPLTFLEQDGSYTGFLADSWRSVNPTTWEFKLRDRSVFHNGDRVAADDVKFSWDRVLNPNNPGLGVVAQLPTVDRVEVADPTTIRIVTKAPDPLLVGRATLVSIIPKRVFESGGADYAAQSRAFAERPIGSGPYRFKSYTPNQQLTVEAFDHPYRQPLSREVVMTFLPETAARTAALQARTIDMMNSVPVDQVTALEGQGFRMNNVPFNNVQGVFLDQIDWQGNPVRELSDKRVRQAMIHAVDRDAINRGLYQNRAQLLTQVLPREVNGHNPELRPYAFDQARARQLLAEAGFPNGFTIDFEQRTVTSDFGDMATAIQAAWQAVGIRTDLSFITDSTVSLDKFNGRARRAPLFGFAITGQFNDGDTQLGYFRGDLRPGLLRMRNAEFDAAFIAAQSEIDPQRRRQLLQRASAILQDEAAYLPVVTTVLIYGTDGRTTTNQGSDAYPRLDLVYKRR